MKLSKTNFIVYQEEKLKQRIKVRSICILWNDAGIEIRVSLTYVIIRTRSSELKVETKEGEGINFIY